MAEKNKGGRPKKELDYELIEELARIQCTQQEIASCLKVDVRTLQRDEEFCRIYKEGQEYGKMSIRRMQFESAKKGNATILVWLGKQYLGQRDNLDVSTTELDEDAITKAIKESFKDV